MSHITVRISGMTCNHCVMAVKKELSALPLSVIAVTIGGAEIECDDTAAQRDAVAQAVERAGYTLTTWNANPRSEAVSS